MILLFGVKKFETLVFLHRIWNYDSFEWVWSRCYNSRLWSRISNINPIEAEFDEYRLLC